MRGAQTVVEVSNLTKSYGGRRGVRAVDDVNLTVRAGEVYGFLGPNGAGKTTALRILLGLAAPTSGSVRVLGQSPGSSEALARIGALVEGPAHYPYLSGRDNLRVVARYAGAPTSAIGAALAEVELGDRADDKFATYSLGMKQRLGVAAALVKDPELVILDEPTNGLDPAGMRDMRRLIARLGWQGRTVVLSSHLLGEVQQICDRVAVLDHGRLLAENTVHELRGTAELVLTVTPSDVAASRLEQMSEVGTVRTTAGGELRVQVAEEHIATVVAALVHAGVAVTEVRRDERQLEDVFFEMTTTGTGKEAQHA